MVNNQRWRNGQEEEMGEMEGLKDKDGNIWVLVSGPVGCRAGEEETVEEKKPVRDLVLEEQADLDVRVNDAAEETGETTEEEQREEGSWIREIVIETLSKDQGWSSSNPAAYGMSPAVPKPLPRGNRTDRRHLRCILLLVRHNASARWQRGSRLA